MTTLVEDDSPRETLLALLVPRIAIRLAYRPPPLPDSIRGMERTAAHLGHAALYALRALVIAIGWAMRGERFGEPASLPAMSRRSAVRDSSPGCRPASATRERPSTVPEPVRVRRARCTGTACLHTRCLRSRPGAASGTDQPAPRRSTAI